MCKRLSLVFEWAFLSGFVGAIPFLLLKRGVAESPRLRYSLQPLLTFLAFTGFYACGLLILIWGY